MGLKMNLHGMTHPEIHQMFVILFSKWGEMPKYERTVLIASGYFDLW